MKKLFYALLLISLSNCASRSTEPKNEDKDSILNYLKSKGISNANVMVVKDYAEYKRLSKNDVLIIPEITFFDGNGGLIEYKNIQKECSQDAYFFIKDYYKGKQLKYNKIQKIDMFVSSYVNLSNDSKIDFSDKSKIYVFINWAIFTNKLNKDSFNLLSLNNNDFTYILIDLDVQKKWNVSNNHNSK